MKKVISALTAATMVASMTAGVMSAYAAYDAASVRYYLATGDDKATSIEVSNDTDTTITIQSYIDCDTDVAPTQILTAGVGLDMPDGITFTSGTSSLKNGTEERTYNLSNGASFTSKRFVNCFDTYDDLLEEVTSNCASGGDWGISVDKVPVWNWATTNQNLTFITDQSDELPLTEFTVTIPKGTKPGEYTIGYADKCHTSRDEVDATYIGGKGSLQTIGVKDGFTITVKGDGTTPTDASTEPTPTDVVPTEAPTQGGTEDPDVTIPDVNEKLDAVPEDQFTWVIDDSIYGYIPDENGEPKEVPYGRIGLYVKNDIGIFGFKWNILIDGKNPADLGFTYRVIRQTPDGYGFETWAPNAATFGIGAVAGLDVSSGEASGAGDNRSLDDGTMFCEIILIGGENVTPGTYTVTIDQSGTEEQPQFEVNRVDNTLHLPTVVDGSITILGEKPDKPTEPTTDTEEPSTSQGEQPTTDEVEPTPGTAKYGDTDINGTVQLRDVVMLNRFLTGYQNQQLSAQGVINANVSRSGESDADTTTDNLTVDDSLTILKVLVGNVAEKDLPVQQK